jgi:hypothetical protein
MVIRWPCRGASTTTTVAGVTTIFTFAIALVVATFVGVGAGGQEDEILPESLVGVVGVGKAIVVTVWGAIHQRERSRR